jgi:4-hydroxy-3-polyprenylbenzoate decarboxylase
MTFAGFLQGSPIPLAPCRTVPLQVPTTAEVVIEGTVDPAEGAIEGPFGNHTGFYAPAGPAALLRISAISRRPGAIVPATVVGPPPMEDCWMARAWERLLLAFLRRLFPSIVDIRFPMEWTFHQSTIISLDQPDPAMVREIAARLWSTPWFSAARLTIFTDAAFVPPGAPDLAWRCINLATAPDDLFRDDSGTRLALNATGSRYERMPVAPDPGIATRVSQRWREYGFT